MEGKTNPETFEISRSDEMIITDLEAVRALTDATKMKILEAVGPEPQTVKQMAKSLKMVPNNLYYHINTLENLGLVKVASTRVVSGIIEKQYIAAARTFTFSRTLITQHNANVDDVNEVMNKRVLSLIEMTTNEVRESIRAGLFNPEHRAQLTTSNHFLNQAQVSLFADKFQELINSPEFEDLKSTAENPGHSYRIAFHVFPLVEAGPDEETDQEKE